MDFVPTYLIMTAALCGTVYAGPLLLHGENCTNFYAIVKQNIKCEQPYTKPKYENHEISTIDALARVEFMCRNRQKERECMNDAFAHCDTDQNKKMTMLDETYSYCNDDNPAAWITNYAETGSGKISTECFRSLQNVSGICGGRAMNQNHPSMSAAFEDHTNAFRKFTSAAFNCIISGGEQAISNTPECSGASWKDAIFNFVIPMTTIPGYSFLYRLLEEDAIVLKNTVS